MTVTRTTDPDSPRTTPADSHPAAGPGPTTIARTGPAADRIDVRATLADLVTADTRRAHVLEELGLDYCCHGGRTLAGAVKQAGLDLDEVTAALASPSPGPASPATTPGDTGDGAAGRPDALSALAQDIVDTHHAYLWEELPRLRALAEKVARVHREHHPELARVLELYRAAQADLEPHLTREEQVIFPAITRLELTGETMTPQGPLGPLVRALLKEHNVVGGIFQELHAITGGYRTPADGCVSYEKLYTGLAAMERDLHLHIHQENNVLLPATLERLAAAGAAA